MTDNKTLDNKSDNFVHPDFYKKISILKKYCVDREQSSYLLNYSRCRTLELIAFRCANEREHQNDYFFDKLTDYRQEYYTPIFGRRPPKEEVISDTINGIMKNNENVSVIIQTCNDFTDFCNKQETKAEIRVKIHK